METKEPLEFEKSYNPSGVENRWYKFWLERGCFKPPSEVKGPAFSIVIPPPNVTGSLHIGHALNTTLQDILVRYKRMSGVAALWVPGTDHAGIATQMMVERSLAEESKTRHDLGREKFIDRVWEWKRESGDRIKGQLSRLGASPDWSRERFTMDEGLSRAVRKVFVELFRTGLIYKDKKLVNWDPQLHTAISDLEVEQRESGGSFWYIKYPVEGDSGEFVVVATTRPETMLGDTAVAVHPDDERYKRFVGKNVILPIVGRPLPVIADEYSDPEKGSGAVKITPAHDFNDFEVGRRHSLPMIDIFDSDARLNENVPPRYVGLDRYEARKRVVEELESAGLLEKIEEQTHTVPYGDRSGVVVEPRLTDQWYVDAEALARPAIEAVERGRTRFVPKRWVNTYYEWMRNIQPWCISRQIWWGHRIPAWYGPDGRAFVAMTEKDALRDAEAHYGEPVGLRQDEDVLDTWFSSALWPFSTLGWPDSADDLEHYYPTSVLVTGFDIIFFWVARMIMMGLRFMGDVPFSEVYIHGLIRDEKGDKMSKTKGNAIDPLEIIDKYGADSLRFSLTALATQGGDVKLSMSVIEGYRNFMNKIWNASRFLFLNLEGFDPERGLSGSLLVRDKWILTKLNMTVRNVTDSLDGYEFDKAARVIYQFIWGDFCDWYIELVKPSLLSADPEARAGAQGVLVSVLLRALRLLHPIAPFITEEIFQRLRSSFGVKVFSHEGAEVESIMLSAFPEYVESECDEGAFEAMEFVKEVIVAIRNLRAVVGLHPSARVGVTLSSKNDGVREMLESNSEMVTNLAKLSSLNITADQKPEKAIAQVIDGLEVFLPVEGIIDLPKEIERITRNISKLDKDLAGSEKKLANRSFLERAPGEVVDKERERFKELSTKRKKLNEVLRKLTLINA